MRKANFLGVYGHAALDIIYSSEGFPQPNTCVELRGRHEHFGGTGANIARIASQLGVRTALASHVGADFPQEFMDALRQGGVDTTDVFKVKGARTPFIIMVSDKDHNQIGFVDQAAVLAQEKLPVRTHTVDSSRVRTRGDRQAELHAQGRGPGEEARGRPCASTLPRSCTTSTTRSRSRRYSRTAMCSS